VVVLVEAAMAAKDPERRKLAATVAARSRHRGDLDPGTIAARRETRAAALAAHISEVVGAAPALTPEQRTRLAGLLDPFTGGAA
jgi:hypothetical protein